MVWLTKWIRQFNPNARVLIITDRDELDEQIERVYNGVEEQIYRTKSGKDLLQKLNEESVANPRYYEKMSTLLDELIKRKKVETIEYEKYLKELAELSTKVKKPAQSNDYPATIDTTTKRNLYDNHSDRFLLLMNRYLPNWEKLKKELNQLPVSHADWAY